MPTHARVVAMTQIYRICLVRVKMYKCGLWRELRSFIRSDAGGGCETVVKVVVPGGWV